MVPAIRTDGSAPADAPERIEIDASDPATRWRYRCPNGHTTVEPTNGGVWCRSCARAADVVDPHHHDLLDKRTGELVPWSAVEWVGDDEP